MNNDTDININNNDGNKQHNISDENEEKEILKEESNKDDDNDKECLLFELGNYLNKYKSIKPKKRNHAYFENDVTKFYGGSESYNPYQSTLVKVIIHTNPR